MGRVVARYSEAFKLKVVSELGSGKLRIREGARRRYGIKGTRTVPVWVAKYGGPELQVRMVRVERPGGDWCRINGVRKNGD